MPLDLNVDYDAHVIDGSDREGGNLKTAMLGVPGYATRTSWSLAHELSK